MEKETKVAAVSMKNITKTFGSVIANDKVNLDIYKGEILSLLGENGSGKTTLMNMLSGIYFPDEGQIFINGKEEVIKSPKDALRLGIGMVHQHFKLIDVLSATENIILGLEGRLNIIDFLLRIYFKTVFVTDLLYFTGCLLDIKPAFQTQDDILGSGKYIDQLKMLMHHTDSQP